MVGRKKLRRGSGQLGNHQKNWLWGRHVVLETLRASRWRPLELRADLSQQTPETRTELQQLARSQNLEIVPATADELRQLCHASDHQGLAARMPAYPYVDVNEALNQLNSKSLALVLCGIQDPFNFGSILRSADLFGLSTVFVPDAGQAEVSAHVVRSSVGAVNWLRIARCPDLLSVCRSLQMRGLQLLAATERGSVSLANRTADRGAALLIGNEGTGVPTDLLALADLHVQIPIGGHVGSLNAAVAAGILCHELRRTSTAAVEASVSTNLSPSAAR